MIFTSEFRHCKIQKKRKDNLYFLIKYGKIDLSEYMTNSISRNEVTKYEKPN